MKKTKHFFAGMCLTALALTTIPTTNLTINPTIAEAATKSAQTIKISKADITSKGASEAIQNALNTAQSKATADKPYKIIVPKGTYKLNHSLYIYSNTELVLNGVKLLADKNKNAIHVGALDDDSTGVTGYYYKNITITGGTLDGQNKSGTLMKVGHASNFIMTGVTLQNTKNAHLMETAGVKSMKIKKCKFKNQQSTSTKITYNEAIQLDILYPEHMPGYRAETINTTDVVIENSSFSNVPRGIGSHTAILNQPLENITIKNCTFNKMSSVAIQGLGWKNCVIANNTITDSPRGICYYHTVATGKGTYLPSKIAKVGKTSTSLSDAYQTPEANQNIVIQNNKLSLNSIKDPHAEYERVAIMISGVNLTDKSTNIDGSGNLPLGNYYPSGITVKNNTITTAGHGIRFVNTNDSEISNNTITSTTPNDSISYNGVQIMSESNKIRILNNTIKNSITNGIYVNRNSNVTSITGNKILVAQKYGIDIEASNVDLISQNEISDIKGKGASKARGIFVYDGASVSEISKNMLTQTGDCGIHISKATAKQIISNQISHPGRYGIMFSSNAAGEKIADNNITDATVKDVHIASDSTVSN